MKRRAQGAVPLSLTFGLLALVATVSGICCPAGGGPHLPCPPVSRSRSSGRLLSLPLQQTAVSLFLTWIDFALCFVTNDAENHVPRDPLCRAAP